MGSIYIRSGEDKELRQGEFLSNLVRYDFDPAENVAHPKVFEFNIILTQDCDLLQDFSSRKDGAGGNLDHILLIEAQPADVVRASVKASDLWKPIAQNKNERFQILSPVPAEDDADGVGVSSLVVDFRSVFSMSAAEIYRQTLQQNGARRRCRLNDLYREHLQLRLAYFCSRIMLPEPHAYVKLTA